MLGKEDGGAGSRCWARSLEHYIFPNTFLEWLRRFGERVEISVDSSQSSCRAQRGKEDVPRQREESSAHQMVDLSLRAGDNAAEAMPLPSAS